MFRIILIVGKSVWKPILDLQRGQWRLGFGWFTMMVVNFDVDEKIGKWSKCP